MIIQMDEDGHRCDERCYNAKHIGCRCVCGGKNHGLGLNHALENYCKDGGVIEVIIIDGAYEGRYGLIAHFDSHAHEQEVSIEGQIVKVLNSCIEVLG